MHVLGMCWMCEFMDLYTFEHIHLECLEEKDYDGSPVQRDAVVERALAEQPLYFMLEQNRKTFEIPEIPFEHPDLSWERLAAFQRPKNGLWVTVWRVRSSPAAPAEQP